MARKSLTIGIIILFLFCNISFTTLSDENGSNKIGTVDKDIDWWPMFHHDEKNTGYSTSKAPNTSNICWKYFLYSENGHYLPYNPVISNGKVYYNPGSLICLDLYSGEFLWGNSNVYSGISPSIDENRLFGFTNFGGKSAFSCINADNGSIIWSNSNVSRGFIYFTSPTIYNNRVYIGVNNVYDAYNKPDDCIFCLNAETGEEIWQYRFIYNIDSTPAVMDGKLYFGNGNGDVYCLDAYDGSELWKYDVNSLVLSSPTVYNNSVYLLSWSKLFCFDADSGNVKWSFSSTNTLFNTPPVDDLISTPAIFDDKIYIGSIGWSPFFYCLDARTGEMIWSYKIPFGLIRSSPAIADEKVYFIEVGRHLGMCCLDANNGDVIWNDDRARAYYSSPVIADGKVVVFAGVNYEGFEIICYGEPPQLEICDIYSYDRSVFVTVSNIGDSCAANNVYCNLSIKGGMLNKINVSLQKHYAHIYPGEFVEFNTDNNFLSDQFIFGIGQIDVNVTVDVENAESTSKQVQGFVFGPFVFI